MKWNTTTNDMKKLPCNVKKKRSFEPQPLRKVLQQVTAQRNLSKGLNEVKVKLAWEKTVGKHVMQYTTEIKLREKPFMFYSIQLLCEKNSITGKIKS